MVEILQNFGAFSEYMNFKSLHLAGCAAVRSKSEVMLEFIVNARKNAAQDVLLLTKRGLHNPQRERYIT